MLILCTHRACITDWHVTGCVASSHYTLKKHLWYRSQTEQCVFQDFTCTEQAGTFSMEADHLPDKADWLREGKVRKFCFCCTKKLERNHCIPHLSAWPVVKCLRTRLCAVTYWDGTVCLRQTHIRWFTSAWSRAEPRTLLYSSVSVMWKCYWKINLAHNNF